MDVEVLKANPPGIRERRNYKYNIHPLIKFGAYMGLNFLIFYGPFQPFRLSLLFAEALVAFLIRFRFRHLWGFLKIVLINMIPIYLLFYFASWNWLTALEVFGSYALTLGVMLFGTFVFVQATPPFELILALRRIGVPKSVAFSLTIAISWLPFLTQEIKRIIVMQQSRGYRFRLTQLGPVLIPAILAMMDFSINLTNSTRARGFEL